MPYCYTEDNKKATTVNIGDKVICDARFETYATDDVKTFKYTLAYGSGLKLIKEDNMSSSIKKGNTYTFTYSKPRSVSYDEDTGTFIFEVVGTTDLTFGIKDIKFITTDNRYYYTDDDINSLNIN